MPSELLSGAPLSEPAVNLHFAGLLSPGHTSPNREAVPQGDFPSDLTELNLMRWADLVQDVAGDLQVLPPSLSLGLGPQVVALLELLEKATQVGFCCHCCLSRPRCTCMGATQPAPPMLWSQIVQQAPGYRVTCSTRGVTDPSTSMGGIPGYVVPPPGLTLLDYSIWSMPPWGPLYPRDYLDPHHISLPLVGPHNWQPL